jgi:hypothetical protein
MHPLASAETDEFAIANTIAAIPMNLYIRTSPQTGSHVTRRPAFRSEPLARAAIKEFFSPASD